MRGKKELSKLRDVDIYSLMLFAMYKISEIPEYSTLSELVYILDKNSLLKLCEYFGGMTIKIPTVKELEDIVYALIMYQMVDIDGKTYEEALNFVGFKSIELRTVKKNYLKIKEVLSNYSFQSRSGKDES